MKLDEDQARSLLAAARVGRLATADSRGRPHVVPVTFALEAGASGDVVHIAVDHKPKTTTNLKRLRNIVVNPAVSLLADQYAEDWQALWWVRADGKARIVTDDPARQRPVDLLVAKYPQYAERRPQGPVISISILRCSGWAATPDALL